MKLIIYPDVDIWEFVLSGLETRSDVVLFPLNRHSNIIQKVARKYGSTIPLPVHFVLGLNLQTTIKHLMSEDVVIVAEYTDPALILAISRIIPEGVSCYIWLWNHKGNKKIFANNLQTIYKCHFQVVTYDELDAEKYGFGWHTQFFNIKPFQQAASLQNNAFLYDFFFVGYAKNRVEEIERIHSMLSSYSCKFVTVQAASDYIPYSRYMEMAKQSRCIVEIVHTGDPSCTLRPLEAMSIRRKLLTNNPAVRNYSFYRPQNIFILGEDDLTSLSVFLHSPFEPLPSDIVDSFDVNSWVEIFR
jgi:hypothetical protein